MRTATVRAPDVMLLVGTRMALGIGIGLLVASRLDERVRKGAGVALLAVGALTTVPILLNMRASSRERLGATGAGGERGATGEVREAPMPA